MNIGGTHIDGSLLIAGVLVVAGLLANYMLRNRPAQPVEHPSVRIVRLVRGTKFGIQPNYLYFVEESNDEVQIVTQMSYARRTFHPRGRVLRLHGGKVQVAEVVRNEDPLAVRSNRFVDFDD